MASLIIPLPTATVSSGGTAAVPIWDISDATSISLTANVSTAPGLGVEVSFNSTGTTFYPLIVPWLSNSTAGVPLVVTSSGAMVLDGISVSRMRFTTSVASTGGITVDGSKLVEV